MSAPVFQFPTPVTADALLREYIDALTAGNRDGAVTATGKMVDYTFNSPPGTAASYNEAAAKLESFGDMEGRTLDSLKADEIVPYARAHHATGNGEHLREILEWLVAESERKTHDEGTCLKVVK